jgi:hypothetical protein
MQVSLEHSNPYLELSFFWSVLHPALHFIKLLYEYEQSMSEALLKRTFPRVPPLYIVLSGSKRFPAMLFPCISVDDVMPESFEPFIVIRQFAKYSIHSSTQNPMKKRLLNYLRISQ